MTTNTLLLIVPDKHVLVYSFAVSKNHRQRTISTCATERHEFQCLGNRRTSIVAEATKRVNQNTVYVGAVSDGARIGDPTEENVALLTFRHMGDKM